MAVDPMTVISAAPALVAIKAALIAPATVAAIFICLIFICLIMVPA
jgi:hypothetical protein